MVLASNRTCFSLLAAFFARSNSVYVREKSLHGAFFVDGKCSSIQSVTSVRYWGRRLLTQRPQVRFLAFAKSVDVAEIFRQGTA